MSLTPGTRLGVYEITALIGVGGMGEVYKATDTNLKRAVAIKVLPTLVAADAERLARFQREAEVLAALNHPNIAAIYGLERSSGTLALVMELVEGDDLSQRIARGAIPIDEALPIAKQIAEALEAAHERGIIHRDLKPANIKVRSDGTVKVLDFGLAKAMESPAGGSPSMTQSPTLTTPAMTQAGMILGTAAYMSPEQAKGRTVDRRTDVWAFGAVLFEMLTGTRAFGGTDIQETFVAIMRDEPNWTRLPGTLSPTLATFLKGCLHKDLKQRVGDIHDVRLALEGAFETAVPQTAPAATSASPGRWPWMAAFAVASLVIVALAGGILYLLATRRPQPEPSATVAPSVQDLQITQLTTSGIASRPVISPDGKYVAYVQQSQVPGPGGSVVAASSVWIRQVATSSNVQIVAPEPLARIDGLTVTPDGNYVDYVRTASGAAPALWRVSFLGGTPKKLLENIWTPIGWSPDGRQMAFVRSDTGRGVYELVLAEADGGNPRVLATRTNSAGFSSLALVAQPSVRPAWSLDGRLIAVPGAVTLASPRREIVFVDTTSGAEQAVPVQGLAYGLEWLDAGSLVLDQQAEIGGPSQLWRLAYPSGAVTRLTNDLGSYIDVSLTAARDSLVTTKTDRRVAIWVSDGSGAHAKEVVSASQSSGTEDDVTWAADRVLFTSTMGGHRSISSVGQDGGTSQEVVTQGVYPTTTSDGRTVVFRSTEPARTGLWKVTDGGRPAQLTGGQGIWPRVTHDDRSVVFSSSRGDRQSLWMVSIDGGTPVQLTNRFASQSILSPDGKAVAFGSRDDEGRPAYAICNLPDCSSLRLLPQLPGGRLTWTPDSTGFLYVAGTPQNLWVESLDGQPPRQLTHFTDDRQIADAAWSRDGTRLAIARTTTATDIVLFRGLKR